MDHAQNKVGAFHNKFGLTIGKTPAIREPDLRAELIREEAKETFDAIHEGNLPDAVDGLADLIYVCLGAALSFGVDLEPIFNEVHRANMTKEGGGKRDDGKILKPAGWKAPDIEGELKKQGWTGST